MLDCVYQTVYNLDIVFGSLDSAKQYVMDFSNWNDGTEFEWDEREDGIYIVKIVKDNGEEVLVNRKYISKLQFADKPTKVHKLINKLLEHRVQSESNIYKLVDELKEWEDKNKEFLFSDEVNEETEKKANIFDTAVSIIEPIFYTCEYNLVNNNKLPPEYYLTIVTDHVDKAMKEVYG